MEEKEKYILGIIFARTKNQKAKIKTVGKTLSLLTLLVLINKCLAERISKEKGVSWEREEDIVVDDIKEGMKTIKK